MEIQSSLIDIVERELSSGKVKLPVFNPIALRIQKEVAREDPDVKLVEKLIVKDQALTTELLKVSNSSFYRGLAEVSTIHNAIVRLGISEVSNIVAMITQECHFRSTDPIIHGAMRKLWKHSIACAIGSYWLSKECRLNAIINEAFVAGLLHDVGKLLILKILKDIDTRATARTNLSYVLVEEALDKLHAEVGYVLLRQWNLPEKLCLIAQKHHGQNPDLHNHLLAVVRLANLACRKLGIGFRQDTSISLMTTEEFNELDLTDVDLAKLEIKLEDSQALAA